MVKIIVEINGAGTEVKVYCSEPAEVEVVDFSQMTADILQTTEFEVNRLRYKAENHLDHAVVGMVQVYP